MPKREAISNLSSSASNLLVLTETWLTNDVNDVELLADLPNFNIFRKDREGSRGGGVLIAASQKLPCSVINIATDLEIVWLLCRARTKTVLLGVCYRPPRNSPDFPEKLNILTQLHTAHSNASVVLLCDFNYPSIDWTNRVSIVSNSEATNFIDVCLNFNLAQLVSEPTRITQESANILDLILTNSPESLSSITYLKEISDHKVIQATFNFATVPRHTSIKTIRLYDKANYEAINDDLITFLPFFEADFESRSVEANWSLYETKVDELVNIYPKSLSALTLKNHGSQDRSKD